MSIVLEVVFESLLTGSSRYIISEDIEIRNGSIRLIRGESYGDRECTADSLFFDVSYPCGTSDSKGCTRQELI